MWVVRKYIGPLSWLYIVTISGECIQLRRELENIRNRKGITPIIENDKGRKKIPIDMI